ncbi:MAG: BON domain-containing protein [Oligoflexus sp.]
MKSVHNKLAAGILGVTIGIGVACTPAENGEDAQLNQQENQNDVDTGVNERYDGDSGISADQQSNDEEDITITQAIRQSLTEDDELSIYAQNLTVVTKNGQVHLAGPVRSLEEQEKIKNIASRLVGKENVHSEIIVDVDEE